MNTAAKVAGHKTKNPELYCPTSKCLWRTGGGYCPRHSTTVKVPSQEKQMDKSLIAFEELLFKAKKWEGKVGFDAKHNPLQEDAKRTFRRDVSHRIVDKPYTKTDAVVLHNQGAAEEAGNTNHSDSTSKQGVKAGKKFTSKFGGKQSYDKPETGKTGNPVADSHSMSREAGKNASEIFKQKTTFTRPNSVLPKSFVVTENGLEKAVNQGLKKQYKTDVKEGKIKPIMSNVDKTVANNAHNAHFNKFSERQGKKVDKVQQHKDPIRSDMEWGSKPMPLPKSITASFRNKPSISKAKK